MSTKRPATHAGSWYSSKPSTLSTELDGWLQDVPDTAGLPAPFARAIIAPHAGYSYSGPTAAWAYKALDLSRAKRVFLLGPSHHFYLTNCALSTFAFYGTPLGDLKLDQAVMEELYKTGKFGMMKEETDEDEHSLELHLPYIYKMLSKCFSKGDSFPTLIPILVGNTSRETEKEYGAILAPYLADPESIFIISSDFAHWGLRFQYTYYLPANARNERSGTHLRASDRGKLENPKIYESIEKVDKLSMDFIQAGNHDDFLSNLQATGNTVCGRHPIGIIMAAMEALADSGRLQQSESAFNFVQYTRSSNCVRISDSSVSYASAYAVINCKEE